MLSVLSPAEQVVALWSEGHAAAAGLGGSQERMFARVRRFYRPEVRGQGHMQRLSVPVSHGAVCLPQHLPSKQVCHVAAPFLPHALQETPFAGITAPGQLFRSNHIDDRLGLAAVQRRCHVALLLAGQHAAAGAAGDANAGGQAGAPSFTCQLQLDHEQMVLGVLPPECLPAQSSSAGAADPIC